MPYINDRVFDIGLQVLTDEADRLDICSSEPATFMDATVTLTRGNKTGISVGAPEDRTPTGRKVAVAPITDGSVTASGTATAWAITDSVNSRLLAAGPLQAPQTITSGNSFSLNAFDVGIPDAA